MSHPFAQYRFRPAPVLRIKTTLHVLPETRMRPVPRSPYISMFHRVVMNVVHVLSVVSFMAYDMLPIPNLPYPRIRPPWVLRDSPKIQVPCAMFAHPGFD